MYVFKSLWHYTTLVPEAFFYSLLANFATRIASYIFVIGTKRFDQRFALQISKWKKILKESHWDQGNIIHVYTLFKGVHGTKL